MDLIVYLNIIHDLKSIIFLHTVFENLGQTTMLSDIFSQSFNTIGSNDKPQFERSKSSAQRNSPML